MAEVITPTTPEKDYGNKKIVFLAGPIKGAPNWQKQAIADLSDLDVCIANPRRENSDGFNMDLQIEWESRFLAAADVIMFWIPPKETDIAGRDYAQTTRFELSEWAVKTNYNSGRKKIVVGIDEAFYGRSYIAIRLSEKNIAVYNNYADTLAQVKQQLTTGAKLFFTSDTHFGSKRTLLLSRRPFSDIEQMNEILIANWNKVVAPQDEVYHLGDFGDLQIAPRLNGKIHLILGNYEQALLATDGNYKKMLEQTFAEVLLNGIVMLKDGSNMFITHKPSECRRDMFNAFGHIHGLKKVNYLGVNVGVDGNHFLPMSEDDILFYKKSLQTYDYEVFI